MGFSTTLQGRSAHEALLLRQDAELRLLETMKRCLTSKVRADREYALALTAAAAQGAKVAGGGANDDLAGSCVQAAWRTMMDEFECAGKLLRQNADLVETKTLDALNALHADKRKARKFYQEEHTRIAQQFTHVSYYYLFKMLIFTARGVECFAFFHYHGYLHGKRKYVLIPCADLIVFRRVINTLFEMQ